MSIVINISGLKNQYDRFHKCRTFHHAITYTPINDIPTCIFIYKNTKNSYSKDTSTLVKRKFLLHETRINMSVTQPPVFLRIKNKQQIPHL